ncbi:MAG: DUF2480 family protein [Pedobacter sp.]
MEVQENIINKVAQSGLVSIDLADLNPAGERIFYDIKNNLFQGLMLREKDFREFIKEHNWEFYSGKHIAIGCSADAIVPTWAYMLLANRMAPYAKTVVFGNLELLETILFERALSGLDLEKYRDQRVVIKGCGEIHIPSSAYIDLTVKLTEIAKSIMYGEPCSTVPIYKRKSPDQSGGGQELSSEAIPL